LDDTIDEIVGTIASELLNKNPDREKVSKLAEALDSQSNSEGKARYKAALQILEKAYGFYASDHHMPNFGPSANRLVSSILALIGLNLNNEDIKEVIGKFPGTLAIGEENIERKRAYFGYTKEELADVVKKFPSILGLGEENIERKRAYFGFAKEEFANVVKKFPRILGLGEENIERKRAYFGFAKEEFVNVVKKFPSILSLGEENIERKRAYFGFAKEEFANVVKRSFDILSLGEENIERKRAYFGFAKEEFANVVKKFPSILSYGEENIERKRAYFVYTKEEFANVVKRFPSILSLGEENIERRREFLGLDIERFSKLVFRIPSILGFSEDNLERRFGWYKRHFGIGKEELVARLEEKPPLYFNLFSSSFYTRVLLRAKTVTANGKVLNDVRDLASILWFNEREFLEKRSNGIRTEEYEMLKHIARVTDEANKQRSKIRQ